MKIGHTRALVRAALAGTLKDAPVRKEPYFGLAVPESCGDVPAEVLNPRNTWSDKGAYDETARDLTKRFESNFKKYEPFVGNDVKEAGIYAQA
jgi:phosphoenolpyruvate carboxykinase (ATP)